MNQEQLLREIKQRLTKLNEELDDARERLARIEGELLWLRRFMLALLGGMISLLLKVFFG
jgi:predicted  nucleic acid-binding Zn-ribbon protein